MGDVRGAALRRIRLRSATILITGLLIGVIALGLAGVALAAWSDVTPSLVALYGFTEDDLAAISQGYGDGSWKPHNPMLRKHFVKMASGALGISQATPSVASFSDVLRSDPYFPYVEGAAAAGLTTGVGGGKFSPDSQITREQAVAMIARWLARSRGVDTETKYDVVGATAVLAAFSDGSAVTPTLRDEMAYAIDELIVKGSQGRLDPLNHLSRVQGAALLLRAAANAYPVTTTTLTSGTSPTETTSTTTTTTLPTSTTTSTSSTSTVAGARIFGRVFGSDDRPVAGATVRVVYNAADPKYVSGASNLIGAAVTTEQGYYQLSTPSLALGSLVDVSVIASGYTSVFMYGVYDELSEEVSFLAFGKAGGDRRMPVGSQMPPFPFEGLLPD
ncbi:MAG: hypothetical protein GX113_02825 [Actinobacteria bacterium]|nr:hypothetical protein [Actinomycetota bacterium]